MLNKSKRIAFLTIILLAVSTSFASQELLMNRNVHDKLSMQSSCQNNDVLIIVAMQEEAEPIINQLKLVEIEDLSLSPLSPKIFSGKYKNLHVTVATSNKSSRFRVNQVSTQPAAVLTYVLLKKYDPCYVMNIGTAGAFKSKKAIIGDVYIGNETFYFDREIPVPGYENYGFYRLETHSISHKIQRRLGFKVGAVATGSTFVTTPDILRKIDTAGGTVKDMESAAIAEISDQFGKNIIVLKSVTDYIDHHENNSVDFVNNLRKAAATLNTATLAVLDYLSSLEYPTIKQSAE